MRIDKIRRKDTSNVIDLDISRFDIKFDNFNYPIDSPVWYIRTETVAANINILKLITNYKKQIQLMKEFRHFIRIQKMSVSEATLVSYFNLFKNFIDFANSNNILICAFIDIDYIVIEKYVAYLRTAKGAAAKYRDIKNIFKKISQTKGIVVSEDLKNNNYVQINLNKNTTKMTHYTEDEFRNFSKTIVSIMEDYLTDANTISESCFVMSAYWFISICTGFNKTGLDSLTSESFEYFDENKNILTVIGEKNRGSNGYQFINISFNDENNNLLTKVINKLLQISSINSCQVNSKSLFIHKQNCFNQYNIYNGNAKTLIKNKIYLKYANLNNCSIIPSTAKIRNYRSLFLYDKSKNEQLVADIMNHRSVKTTIEHYIKHTIQAKDNLGLFLVQNLLTSFAENETFNDWVSFQNHFDLKSTSPSIIVKNITDGYYNTPMGACIKNTDIKEPCTSYINCFKCRHYSVIGERDLWKILSFRDCILEFSTLNGNEDYNWIIQAINSLLVNFNRADIEIAKTKLRSGRHPFWKNNIMIKQIISDYEGSK